MGTLAIFLTLIIFPFGAYEGIRFYQSHQLCVKEKRQNEAILDSITCDAWHRHQFGSKVNGVCEEAERESQISPLSCTWKRMWSEGEVFRVWSMFTQSYVMLWATTVPIVCFLIWTWFASRNARIREERMMQMQGEMYEKTLSMMGKTIPSKMRIDQNDENYVDLVDTSRRRVRMKTIQ